MVVRTRLRAFLIPFVLCIVSGAAGSYFVWHAMNGERGLKAKAAYKAQLHALEGELSGLVAERQRYERRVAMIQTESVDRDLLEEQARLILGRVGRNDLVVMTRAPQN